ncbi:MAG: META domain-containing protein [Terrimonas sp.]|nr:META domain-containing protein [Terrimonas sp.]OJY97928.1 MAG: hypothetical protein BGP13_09685 [Sphingobacteriales bacterium 40-81]
MRKMLFIIAISFAATCTDPASNDTEETNPDSYIGNGIQIPEDLLNKEWKLVELNGSSIVLDPGFREYPHLKLTNLVSTGGNLGCNGFGASVHISAADSIKISGIIATEMACPNLEVERRFAEALENARTFRIQADTLLLHNDKKELIARLVHNQ